MDLFSGLVLGPLHSDTFHFYFFGNEEGGLKYDSADANQADGEARQSRDKENEREMTNVG
jgi:hypothetical protein